MFDTAQYGCEKKNMKSISDNLCTIVDIFSHQLALIINDIKSYGISMYKQLKRVIAGTTCKITEEQLVSRLSNENCNWFYNLFDSKINPLYNAGKIKAEMDLSETVIARFVDNVFKNGTTIRALQDIISDTLQKIRSNFELKRERKSNQQDTKIEEILKTINSTFSESIPEGKSQSTHVNQQDTKIEAILKTINSTFSESILEDKSKQPKIIYKVTKTYTNKKHKKG